MIWQQITQLDDVIHVCSLWSQQAYFKAQIGNADFDTDIDVATKHKYTYINKL